MPSEASPPVGRPAPFGAYTTPEMWNDPHISARMLAFHLDPQAAPASRPRAFIEASAQWIISRFQLGPGSRVLDLGCGPGLYANRIARCGAAVLGVDVSERSLAHARDVAAKAALPARFVLGSYLTEPLGSGHDLALLIYEDYCAMSPDQRGDLLGRVGLALRPGGAMLFDVTAAARFASFTEGVTSAANLMDGFWSDVPYSGTLRTWTYPELGLVGEHYLIQPEAGEPRSYWNWTQCLTPQQVQDELRGRDLRLLELLGDVAGAPYDPQSPTFAVIATRR